MHLARNTSESPPESKDRQQLVMCQQQSGQFEVEAPQQVRPRFNGDPRLRNSQ